MRWILVMAATILTLLAVEAGLRISGHRPGSFRKLEGFEPVDSLIVYKNFSTDEAGIYKFSSWITDSVASLMEHADDRAFRQNLDGHLKSADNWDQIYGVAHELLNGQSTVRKWFSTTFGNEEWDTEFVGVHDRIKLNGPRNEWERVLIESLRRPYNKEGFRSIPFKRHVTDRPRILVIGDSFVYGMTASPHFNSFTDRLLARGYMVYSAGIPGTDPAQYAAIAQKYMPILMPDLVVLCFYPANDLMPFPREPHFEKPHEHMTNAGFFDSSPEGIYLVAQEAYEYYLSLVSIPRSTSFGNLCRTSSISSLLWGSLYGLGLVKQDVVEQYENTRRIDQSERVEITKTYMDRFYRTVEMSKVPCITTIIPVVNISGESMQEVTVDDRLAFLRLFEGRPYHLPVGLDARLHFPKGDCHFNNEGSLKFANFLDSLIQNKLQNGQIKPYF